MIMNKKVLIFLMLCFAFCSDAMGCTIFVFTQDGKTYFCNNEDFSDHNTEIHFNPAKKGKYAWVYFGFSNNWAQGGVNEKGLCWDWVSRGGEYEETWKRDPSKKSIKGNPCEKLIETCETVEEAIKFYEKYNDASLRESRVMFGDRFGNSALLEWKDGAMNVIRNNGALQAFGYKGSAVESFFANNHQEKSIAYYADALNEAHQEGQYPTLYSYIVSMADGKIYLYKDHNYTECVEIDFLKKLKGGYAKYKIAELFNGNDNHPECVLKKSR